MKVFEKNDTSNWQKKRLLTTATIARAMIIIDDATSNCYLIIVHARAAVVQSGHHSNYYLQRWKTIQIVRKQCKQSVPSSISPSPASSSLASVTIGIIYTVLLSPLRIACSISKQNQILISAIYLSDESLVGLQCKRSSRQTTSMAYYLSHDSSRPPTNDCF